MPDLPPMDTAPTVVEQAQQSATGDHSKAVEIDVDKKGAIFFDGERITLDQLKSRLTEPNQAAQQNRDRTPQPRRTTKNQE